MSKAVGAPARRVEVFTGAGRRRTWSAEDKAAIIAESYAGSDTVSGVARRHGLTASQLFAWRREASCALAARDDAPSAVFVPAVVEAPSPESTLQSRERRQARRSGALCGIIEVEIDGVSVQVGRGAEAKIVAAVIRVLRAGA
jgi:transposase